MSERMDSSADGFAGARSRFLGLTIKRQEKQCTHGLGESSQRCLSCTINAAAVEIARLEALINSPVVDDFIQAVPLEAAHQQERWSADHDAGKSPDDWLWLVAYLCTKASQAARYGDTEKHRHHIITAGAALLNWHRHATGELTQMRPGTDQAEAEARGHA